MMMQWGQIASTGGVREGQREDKDHTTVRPKTEQNKTSGDGMDGMGWDAVRVLSITLDTNAFNLHINPYTCCKVDDS